MHFLRLSVQEKYFKKLFKIYEICFEKVFLFLPYLTVVLHSLRVEVKHKLNIYFFSHPPQNTY